MAKDMNLNLIRTFCLIYEYQGISRVADELHLTQPTVSYSLKELRKAFNDQLFYRDRNALYPTPLSVQIYPDLRAALDLIESAETSHSRFLASSSEREFVLMLSDLGEIVFLPHIQEAFERSAPFARLRIEPLDVSQVSEKLATGEVDVAIQTPFLDSTDVERTVIYHDTYVVVASKSHPRVQGSLSLEQMRNERFMRINSTIGHDSPENHLLALGLQLDTGILGTRVVSVPGVVMRSELLGIIPYAVVESLGWVGAMQVLRNPVSSEPMEVSLLSRILKRQTQPQRWFVELIKEAVEKKKLSANFAIGFDDSEL